MAKNLHRAVVKYVNAAAQAGMSKRLLPLLTDEERAVWLRGRNTKSTHTPKGASDAEYHFATALECVFGWLYLKNRAERITELFNALIENC
jgi:ribonuclease-3 family protein